MARTLINLDDGDKHWLDREARRRQVPMTQVVREAVAEYRARSQSRVRRDLQGELTRTAGIWRGEDGLAHQQRLRGEWDRRG
ncbi:MAG: ribbon-helix-helix protein, CopG family [Rhodanobacteraceae bacterium]